MAIPIDENVLLGLAGVVFLPTFLFAIKMIMEVGNLKTKHDLEVGAIKQDIDNRFKRQDEANDRMQKEIDMLNQFSYGRDAKSIPSFLSDIKETLEHKNSKEIGLFGEPDSEETQEMKDKKKRKF